MTEGRGSAKTSSAADACLPKIPWWEERSFGLSGSYEVVEWEDKVGDEYVPLEPSLWNNHSFNAMEFSYLHFSFLKNFPSDYQLLIDMSFTKLSDLLEVQFLRFLLVEKAQREKHSCIILEL